MPSGSHSNAHSHDHARGHTHAHSHGPASPHPSQPVSWSILRMTVVTRFAAAVTVSVALWAMVWLAMR
jgi:hypothetical protein